MGNYTRGDMVVVLRTKYKEVPVGAIGTVRSNYDANVAVIFADIHNKRSSYDCFYFKASELKLHEGDNVMEGNYRVAHVQFIEGNNTDSVYLYALYDPNIVIGDICVVKSAHHGFGIARVVDITVRESEKLTREIVCKADFSAYETRMATRKRKAELKRKMSERAAALQELALFKMMAENDAGMAELMKEFDGLEDC